MAVLGDGCCHAVDTQAAPGSLADKLAGLLVDLQQQRVVLSALLDIALRRGADEDILVVDGKAAAVLYFWATVQLCPNQFAVHCVLLNEHLNFDAQRNP